MYKLNHLQSKHVVFLIDALLSSNTPCEISLSTQLSEWCGFYNSKLSPRHCLSRWSSNLILKKKVLWFLYSKETVVFQTDKL